MHGLVKLGIFVCLLGPISAHGPSPINDINVYGIESRLDKSVSFDVSPKLIKSGDSVKVKLSGVSDPKKDDWIGFYSPASTHVHDKLPIKYQFASADDKYLNSGEASLNFRLIAMRDDYKVVFFRGGVDKPLETAEAGPINMSDEYMPTGPRLMHTQSPSELRFMWTSKNSASGHFTIWSTKTPTQKAVYTSSVNTWTELDLCGPPATTIGHRHPGYQHSVVFPIEFGTTYSYTYGAADGAAGHVAGPITFTTGPGVGAGIETHFLAFGDMGQHTIDGSLDWAGEPGSVNSTRKMGQEALDNPGHYAGVLHIGDISYARGHASEWDMYFDQVQTLSSHIPYQICLGNHERDYPDSGSYWQGTDSGGECGVPTERYFITPRKSEGQPWYSLNMGSVHVLFMSTEHNFTVGSDQWKFLQGDLASVDRTVTPWVIFAGHRPMYCDSQGSEHGDPAGVQEVALLMRQTLEPLLVKYKVDLAIWGHHHSYQRTCGVIGEKCMQNSVGGVYSGEWKAPIHLVIGMAGFDLSKDLLSTQPDWIESVTADHWGYSRIHAFNETHMQVEFVRDFDQNIWDQMWIARA